jgi:hypothetical protein
MLAIKQSLTDCFFQLCPQIKKNINKLAREESMQEKIQREITLSSHLKIAFILF